MTRMLHFEAPTALQYFAALVSDDATLPVLEAAVAVAQDADPGLDVQGVLAEVDALGAVLVARLPADAAPLHRLRLLNRYFFHELGFAGNVNDYYDPRNSYLPHVLATRRGIPISLALIYMELAGQAGLAASGVSFPGHFLVKMHLPQGEAVIDPLTGQSLSRDALEERLLPFRQGPGGDEEVPLGLYLQPATDRDILARLLRNLKEIHRARDDARQWLAVQERLVMLLPDDAQERRDRGLAQAAVGRTDLACHDVEAYLARCADAPDASALRRQVRRWRTQPPPSLH